MPEQAHRVFFAEMMERERIENDVVALSWIPFENVRFDKRNFRVINAEFSRDFERGCLLIQRVKLNFRANLARVIDNQSRDVARAGGKIDNAQLIARFNPTANEAQNNRVTAEIAIELPQIFQIALQLGGNRLRPIH